MNTILTKTRAGLLFVAGALLLLVGSFILAAPTAFYATNGIDPGGNVNLLNELNYSERTVHADFRKDCGELYDDKDLN